MYGTQPSLQSQCLPAQVPHCDDVVDLSSQPLSPQILPPVQKRAFPCSETNLETPCAISFPHNLKVHLCVSVYMCPYLYVSTLSHISVYDWYLCLCLYACLWLCVCLYISVCVFTWNLCTCVYIDSCVYMCSYDSSHDCVTMYLRIICVAICMCVHM